MKKIKTLSVIVIVLICFQSCIPIKSVTAINTYKVIEGKPKARKDKKKYTKYKFSNFSTHKKALAFLDTKYDVIFFKNVGYVSHKVFNDIDINFRVEFRFTDNKSQYLWLPILFSKDRKQSYEQGYDEDLDDPIQEGDEYRFIEITVKDDSLKDYLAINSSLRGRLILYLRELTKEYNFYRKTNNL